MAGSATPDISLLEARYTRIDGKGYNTSQNGAGLVDSIQINDWDDNTVFYWSGTDSFVIFDIDTPMFRIWRSGVSSWSYNNNLKIEKYENDVWVDYSFKHLACTDITESQWEVFTEPLSGGRYKFSYLSGLRIDSEWFIEDYIDYKYLVEDNGIVKSYDDVNKVWLDITTSGLETEEDFNNSGMDNLDAVIADNAFSLLTSSTPNILLYSLRDENTKLQIEMAPVETLIKPIRDIALDSVINVDYFSLNTNITGNGILKVIVSVDEGVTWQTWDSETLSWVTITPDITSISTNGIPPTTFNSLTSENWENLRNGSNKIRFAYYFKVELFSDVAEVSKLIGQFDLEGYWKSAIHGTDYDYEYPSNTLMRVNLMADGSYKINY